MKREILFSLLFSLSLGCGSDGMDGGGSDGGGGGGGASSLTCSSGAYCSSWWPLGTQVDELPAPTGGIIESGTYILNDVLAVETSWDGDLRELLVIDGNSFRSTETAGAGTFSTNGNTITFHQKESCGYMGGSFGAESDETSFEYLVEGNSIVLFEEGRRSVANVTIRVGLVFTRHSGDLCEVSGGATCTLDECFCAASLDEELQDNQCGG
ncbi:MAG: hypothetical protein JKY56_27230 [Kofleriaceae bacterium]|nr:hypothetical protein [Kofleriaceae bacterium]